jgi:hypothetical protein
MDNVNSYPVSQMRVGPVSPPVRVRLEPCYTIIMNETPNPYQSPEAETRSPDPVAGSVPGLPGKAQIQIRFNQRLRLPRICAICAEPAVGVKTLLFFGKWSEIVHIFIDRQELVGTGARVSLPFCRRHWNFRRWWPTLAAVLILVPAIVLPILCFVFRQWLQFVLLFGLAIVVADLCFVVRIVRSALRLYGLRINAMGMGLVGVAPRFAEAYKQVDQTEAETIAKDFLDNLA